MAHIYADKITEALACCCLSQLYFQLRDDEKGTFYPMKAESLLARYGEQWDAKNRCTIMLSTANAERKVSHFTVSLIKILIVSLTKTEIRLKGLTRVSLIYENKAPIIKSITKFMFLFKTLSLEWQARFCYDKM